MRTVKPNTLVLNTLLAGITCAILTSVRATPIEQPPPAQPLPARIEIADGPFEPTYESLKQYKCPDWFRDAKLGIWGILTPQSLPEAGDWYARNMYIEGHPQYRSHLEHYGHPSKSGYKDLAALWKLDKFDPDRLMQLYKKAGARYFVVLANHHDNYDNWNSRYHRWNSVNLGPERDVVGLWAKAARKEGLRFGVSEHLARSYSWFNTNKGRDKEGPYAGVPYDGNDTNHADLYFPPHADITPAYPLNPPEWWTRQWFWRMRDLLDTYQPDLLYSDGGVPFDEVGRSLFAHFYNANSAWHGGRLEAVYTIKDMGDHGDYIEGIAVQDVERGILGEIKPVPWQTDTCIGDWFYRTGLRYKPASQVICMLADIVSKNGNLLLNIPLKHNGTIDPEGEKVLADLGLWMAVNGEAIYGTRPWLVFGEGRAQAGRHFNESSQRYDPRDIRFTTRGDDLYALVLGWPADGLARVRSLAKGTGTVTRVSLLGHDGELRWTQTEAGLEVRLPATRPAEHAFALKINGSGLRPAPLTAAVTGPDALGRIVLEAGDAEIHGESPRYEQDGQKDHIGHWANPKDSVSWAFQVLRPGTFEVEVVYSCAPGAEGSELTVESGEQKLTAISLATGSWGDYTSHRIGALRFDKAGTYKLSIKPNTPPAWKVIGLKEVVLAPADAPSAAHARSRFAVMDPLYNATRLAPEPDIKSNAAPWIYGEAELECWRLQVLRDRMTAAKLNVGYPGVFHQAVPKASFRCAIPGDQSLPTTLTLRAVGEVAVKCGDRLIYQSAARDTAHSIELPTDISAKDSSLSVDLATESEPPSILIERGPLATGKAPWHWSGDGSHWAPAVAFAQTRSGVPPHRLEVPAHTVKPAGMVGELYDFGRELLGRIAFRAPGKPDIFVGESTAEARNNDSRHFEQSLALVRDGEGRWISEHPLAFRYLRITGAEATEVECRALFHPTQYRGAFACSDERLTRIWMHSAYTHRICQFDFVVDGVKRDRLPWVDNMILSAAVESYAFGNPELLRRTLTVMGRTADTSDINGIVDYNFLWVIGHDALQRYFADTAYLRREWPRIRAMIERVASKCDTNGLVRPPQNAWVFIDWVDFDKNTSLQMMWLWAQRAGVRLAERMGDQATAAAWTRRADALEQLLRDRAWDSTQECWTDPDKPVPPSRHAHVLSVVSGLAKPAEYPGILRVLKGSEAEPLNSPSMNYYDILARAQLGEPTAARTRLSEIWGAMLDRGASTFWEGYDPNEKGDAAYAFYGRPYGKSLCHAWGAGPVVVLPQLILGLRPTVDGWRRFTLEPSLGELKWACATVPTPHGTIEVEVEGGSVNLRVPMGTTAEYRGQEFAGPCSVKLELNKQ